MINLLSAATKLFEASRETPDSNVAFEAAHVDCASSCEPAAQHAAATEARSEADAPSDSVSRADLVSSSGSSGSWGLTDVTLSSPLPVSPRDLEDTDTEEMGLSSQPLRSPRPVPDHLGINDQILQDAQGLDSPRFYIGPAGMAFLNAFLSGVWVVQQPHSRQPLVFIRLLPQANLGQARSAIWTDTLQCWLSA